MVGSLIIAAALAATSSPLTLDSVLDEVGQRAPALGPQQEQIAANEASQRLAGAWEDPTLEVMVQDVPLPGSMSAEPMHPMLEYWLTQPLNVFGRRGLAKEAAGARVAQAREGLRRTEWDARAQAVMAFYELWMNQEMGAILDRQIAVLQRMRESAKSRYAAGLMMGHHDVLRADAELARMQAERASLADERIAASAMLNVLRGHPRDEEIPAVALPGREPVPELASLLGRAERRPEIASMQRMVDEMSAQRDLAKRMYLPMVALQGRYQQRTGGEMDSIGGELMLSLPLFFWDRQRHDVEMSEAMRRRAEREVDAMRAMTDADLRAAWSRARAADRTLTALESTALPRMHDTVDSALAAYASGQGTFLDLLESVMSLRNLEAERLQAVMRREVARFELDRLLAEPSARSTP